MYITREKEREREGERGERERKVRARERDKETKREEEERDWILLNTNGSLHMSLMLLKMSPRLKHIKGK